MTLADENTTIIGTQVSRQLKNVISAMIRYLFKRTLKYLDQHAEKNFKTLQKKSPERIRTADIQHKDLDKFKLLAYQQGVKAYKIEKDKHDVPTLKYDIRDEHTIVGIYKQIQEGYRIPDNKMRAFAEQFTDTQVWINRVSKVTGFKKSDIEKAFNNDEQYREENVLNQDFAHRAQDIYDRAVENVTGKENTVDLINDLKAINKQPQKDFLTKRLDDIKAKQPKVKAQSKEKQQKSQDKGIER
ncbi:MAG: hypothetical protein ACTH80_04500 [Alkalibacterium gilvum]|uniref:hypothetical protein n=1 Tax=Alkalibacterium gilvum TaxID=1130080 RepID=UPI003F913306